MQTTSRSSATEQTQHQPLAPKHIMSVLCVARVVIMLCASSLESDTGIDRLHHMKQASDSISSLAPNCSTNCQCSLHGGQWGCGAWGSCSCMGGGGGGGLGGAQGGHAVEVTCRSIQNYLCTKMLCHAKRHITKQTYLTVSNCTHTHSGFQCKAMA